MYSIAIVGAGNVAWHLAIALEAAGHRVTEVVGRKLSRAKALAEQLYDARPTTRPDLSRSAAQVVLLALADQAYAPVLAQLKLPPQALVMHTSGALGLDLLQNLGLPHYGVFYPLQTFSKGKEMSLRQVPFLLEASNAEALETMIDLASDLSAQVFEVNSQERQWVHVAAVLACNFTNHLLGMADKLLKPQGLGLPLLKPLIEETIQKAFAIGPGKAQTGPAIRGDAEVMARHKALLEAVQPLWANIYAQMSQSIGEKIA